MIIRRTRDVDALYMLFLGRLPESNFARHDGIGKSVSDSVAQIVGSEEFERRVIKGFLEHGVLPQRGLSLEHLPAVMEWVAEAGLAPLVPGNAAADWTTIVERVLAAPPSYSVLEARYGELAREFVQAVGRPSGSDDKTSAATARSEPESPPEPDLVGGVDIIAGTVCHGWIVDRKNVQALCHLKVKLNGATVKIVAADEYRRDVQDRYGGDGRAGFTVRLDRLPEARELSRASLEIVELTQGVAVLAETVIELSPGAVLRAESEFREELRQLKQAVVRLESALPRLERAQSWPLSLYAAAGPALNLVADPPAVHGSATFCVIVVADPLHVEGVGDTAASVLAQTHAAREVFLLAPAEVALPGMLPPAMSVVRMSPGETPDAALDRLADRSKSSHLIVLDAGVTMVPDALAWFGAALARTGVSVVYADQERVGRDAAGPERVFPAFLSALDRELLMQRNYIGGNFCVARETYRELGGLGRGAAIDARHDLLLRAAARLESGAVVHVPLLLTRAPGPDAAASGERAIATVQAHLDPDATAIRVVGHDDGVGRALPDCAKILWPDDESARISVIVPTRDSVEMAFALIASLRRHSAAWDRLEILLVVGGKPSTPASYAFAELGKIFDRVTVVHNPVPFNWGAVNNMAAELATGNLLVFLNDDMLCVTPDWDVRLRSQLARQRVAVLGGRLLYPNGTLQHAGIVFGDGGATRHEAAGDPAGDGLYLDRTLLVHETAALTGAFLACRRTVFDSLGGFDAARFAITYADTDFCVRARAAGGSVLYDPFLTWIHYESATRGFDLNDESKQRRSDEEFARWRGGLSEFEVVDLAVNPHLTRSPRPFELFHRVDRRAIEAWLGAQRAGSRRLNEVPASAPPQRGGRVTTEKPDRTG